MVIPAETPREANRSALIAPQAVSSSADTTLDDALLQLCSDSVLLVDSNGIVVRSNPAAGELFDCDPPNLVGKSVAELTIGFSWSDACLGPTVAKIRTTGGNQAPVEFQVLAATSAAGPVWILIARSQRDARPANLAAGCDYLTGLANRPTFENRLQRAIERAAEHADYQFAVLFLDLDNFKKVNDVYGHLVGDALLVSAANRFLTAVRPHDMVARRDGDEFTILLDHLADPADAARVAERIAERLLAPHELGELSLSVSASIGIALAERGESQLDLIRRADAAMYRAKAIGAGYCVGASRELATSPPARLLAES